MTIESDKSKTANEEKAMSVGRSLFDHPLFRKLALSSGRPS